MNTNAIPANITQGRGRRSRGMAAILLALMPLAGLAQTPITNVIYQDNFARVGPLDGSTPSPVDAGGATWRACNAAPYNAVIMTDGAQICLTNSPNPTNGFYLNGFLPFTPQVGHLYILSCKIRPLSGGTNWLTLGFATSALTNNSFGAYKVGADWMLVRGDGTQITTFRGPGTVTANNYSAALGSTTNLFTVVLDTTTGNANYGWTFRYYTNGVQVLSSATPYCNFPIKYVGLSASGATGYFQEFTLTDVLMRQSAPGMSEDVQSTTAQVGQTATFWVGVMGDYPQAAYQWMTNSSGGLPNPIPGATNASYTTPVLDMSYNGLNFSVTVTNDYGYFTSASGTLTVVSGPPTVYSATKTASPTSLVVAFSKAVDPVTGLNAANYSLSTDNAPGGVSILSANYGVLSNSVILSTSMLDTNAGYYLTVQHVKDLFGNAMTSSTVPVLPANLVLFLRADSGVVYDNGGSGLVVQWLDQTTNGNHAAQYFGVPTYSSYSGPSARPTTNNINGQLALSFGAGAKPGNFLLAPSSPSLESMVSNTTMYAVAQFSATSPANELVNKTWGNIPAPFDWIAGTSQSVQYGNGGNNAPAGGSGATVAINTPYVLTSTITFPASGGSGTTNFNFYLNGTTNGSGVLRSVVQGEYDGGQPLWVGGRSDLLNGNMKGQIAEIMLFNTTLSGADRTNVDNYLGAKYFPFVIITDLPPSTSSSNGFAVTYTFAASLGSSHGFAIQWQKNGTNIPGANSLTYTTPLLGPDDNGAKFDVKVTLANGSVVYSSTNTLTVLTVPPYITWAGIPIWNTHQVIVLFDVAADPVTATVAENYSLNNSANVLSAAIGDAPNKVVLTTSPLTWNANPGYYTLTVQNVKDMYGNAMVTASPSVGLYPSAALWIRADAGVRTNPDGSLYQWDDLSGNGNILTAGAAAPLLATNAWGDPVVRFTASNGTSMLAASTPSLAITGDMSIIAAVNFATLVGGTNGDIVSKTAGAAQNIPAPYDYYLGTANAVMYRGNGGNSGNGVSYGQFTATSGPPVGFPCVVSMSETGDIISHYVNGRPAGTSPLSNGYHATNNVDAGTPLYIGARQDARNRLAGDMSELIVASMPVSSGDMTLLATYLAMRHHFVLFSTSPTNLLYSAFGGNLTLTWPADYTGWQLQSNSVGLTASSAWFTVAGSTATNQITVTPDATKANVFYRLLYQP